MQHVLVQIAIDSSRHLDVSEKRQRERMGVIVADGVVHVPVELGNVLNQIGVQNVASFVAALDTFPSAFASQCNLSEDQFVLAKMNVLEQLKRNGADPDLFKSREVFHRGMGAMPPREHD